MQDRYRPSREKRRKQSLIDILDEQDPDSTVDLLNDYFKSGRNNHSPNLIPAIVLSAILGTGAFLYVADQNNVSADTTAITGSFEPIKGEAKVIQQSIPLSESWLVLNGVDIQALLAENDPSHHSIVGAPSIDEYVVLQVLEEYGSPAIPNGSQEEKLEAARVWILLGEKYGIDPVYAIAFFIHESSAGTAPGWAGIKPDGTTTHNVGNIICAGYPTCYNRFRDYATWEEGIRDYYELLMFEYIEGRRADTVEEILPIYAPAFENDVQGYIDTVNGLVAKFRGK